MIIDADELQKRFLLRIAGARDHKAYIGPHLLTLGITNTCNIRCVHCETHAPGNAHHSDKAHFLPWEKFVELINDCVDLKVDEIEITGRGEPTTHPLFREMMRHLEDKPIRLKMYTNAACPWEYCSDIIKADHIVIDLCAVDRQQYIDLQGKDLFDRVVENIRRLVSLRDTTKPDFRIEIVYVVNSDNTKQILQMQSLASQWGVNKVYFKPMFAHAYNGAFTLPGRALSDLENQEKKTPAVCLNGWFYMTVMSDGDLTTCCDIHQMPLGDFAKSSLKQIWLSSTMMDMRLMGKQGDIQKKFKACQTCSYYDENMYRAKALSELEKHV